eukprot:CAMPEP_0185765330 /NCGR_PEP_ID=MMETSP1174-20130828/28806_1 /TAXON_ID=35687 /ORGANISM="Dictyocha speculum, Strain CCMP1381" /LENGTH=128 /DNA_ID=CAMNT_0028448393 /DNA_START=71 /DNA_END=457 /DNA_ORIENTATION=-
MDMGFVEVPPAETFDNSKLEEFNAKWDLDLQEKDDKEKLEKETMEAKARQEHADWNAERELKRDGRSTANREEEQVLCEQIEGEIESENPWERVFKLVDLQKEHTDGRSDVNRMKGIFRKMKNENLQK